MDLYVAYFCVCVNGFSTHYARIMQLLQILWSNKNEYLTCTCFLCVHFYGHIINNIFHNKIAWKHWPDTCEFITQTVELWNRWIRLVMLLQQSIEHVSIVYTCNLPLFCNALVHVIYFWVSGQCSHAMPLRTKLF